MHRNILLMVSLLLVAVSYPQAVYKEISGVVTDGFKPLENVNVSVMESDKGVKTDKQGKYTIMAEEGQTLVYSHVGKQSVEIIVEDVTEFLNIDMYDEVNELDEVVITKRKRKTQKELLNEYNTNKNLIKTAYGILDKEKSGFRLRVIDGDDLSLAGIDFIGALQSHLPGIKVLRTPNDPTRPSVFLTRAQTSFISPPSAVFEVDGVLYTDAPTFIQIPNIERIAVIESTGALARYGRLAVGGLIVINTKVGNYAPREPGTDKPYDQAKLRDNFFEEGNASESDEFAMPTYLAELRKANGREEAKDIFNEQEAKYSNTPHFYLEALSFFEKEYSEKGFYQNIAQTLEHRFENNPNVLKALAYRLEEKGNFKWANELYKKIFILRPHYSQSYLDLANNYRDLKKGDNAATLLARYNYLKDIGFFEDSETFSSIIARDFDNLLNQNIFDLGSKKIVKTGKDDFNGTRLVFEWNDSEAEFELQFVDPNNQYYTWNHTLKDNAERIKEEKTLGFSTQEYLIYEPEKGAWRVNVKYLGNKRLTPTYLKVTAYHNFGTKEQRKEVKVFKLNTKNVNRALFAIDQKQSIQVY